MIGKLRGIVDAVGEDELVLDVGGVGYLVECSGRTLARIPGTGEHLTLHIETHVREDAIRLFGFPTEEERAWFARLQEVQGVGARVALAVLDVLSPGEIADAVALEDKASIGRAHGVGPRLAQRVVTELKGKEAPATRYGGRAGVPALGRAAAAPAGAAGKGAKPAKTSGGGDPELRLRADAISALVNLGLDDGHVRQAVIAARDGFDAPPGLDALVKAALKEIGR